MAAGDTYHIKGGMRGMPAASFIGGNSDDGIQIDAFMVTRVAANDTTGTFAIKFNVADNTGTYALLGGGDASAVQYFYFAVVAGEIQIKAALTGPDVAWDMITIGAGIKAHTNNIVHIVHDAAKPKIYVNGTEFSLIKGTLTETDVTEPTFWFDAFALIDGGHIGAADSIGGSGALTLEMKGAVGQVKYWTDALTTAQIDDDVKGIINTTNLKNNWDFTDGVIDQVAGEDGTVVGVVLIHDNYSEFSSKWRFIPPAEPVIADEFAISVENGTGYGTIIKAA